MSKRQTRQVTVDVTIDAPVEVVWQALATGEGLKRWFPFDARVDAKPGGELWLSWGPNEQGAAPLAVCEPGKRLGWIEPRPDEDGEKVELAVDFTLEAKGNQTLVRLVQSGFGMASSWENELDAVSRGWLVFLRTLKFVSERHRGVDRRVVFVAAKVEVPTAEAWRRVFSADGLARSGNAHAGRDGGRLELVTADGDRMAGEVQVWNPPKDLAMVIEGWNDAHLWIEIAPAPQARYAKATLSLYGVDDSVGDGIEARLRSRWSTLFQDVTRQ